MSSLLVRSYVSNLKYSFLLPYSRILAGVLALSEVAPPIQGTFGCTLFLISSFLTRKNISCYLFLHSRHSPGLPFEQFFHFLISFTLSIQLSTPIISLNTASLPLWLLCSFHFTVNNNLYNCQVILKLLSGFYRLLSMTYGIMVKFYIRTIASTEVW